MDIFSLIPNFLRFKREIDNEIYRRIKDFFDSKPINEEFEKWKKELLNKTITVEIVPNYDDCNLNICRSSDINYKNHKKPRILEEFKVPYNIFIESNQVLNSYFTDLYEIVLYIDGNNKTKENIDKIKGKTSKEELALLFYHLSINIDEKYKKILEKYKFFENIDFNDLYYEDKEYQSDNGIYLAQNICSNYSKNIFGNNKSYNNIQLNNQPK